MTGLSGFEINGSIVRRLVDRQFPQWASLPIKPVATSGTDNDIFRLGVDLTVRLPRSKRVETSLLKETQWLPELARQLPLDIPTTIAMGEPDDNYPWQWSVCTWLDGNSLDGDAPVNLNDAASRLGRFVNALHSIDASNGPEPGDHNFWRGEPLANRDAQTRNAIGALSDDFDSAALSLAWDAALGSTEWTRSPVWIHGDLSPGNVLAVTAKVSAVIDFGGLAVGDPACDLMIAWSLFTGESRELFREAVDVDDGTWQHGRGWALLCALNFIPYYRNTNVNGVRIARHTLDEILADND
jgi:aminoglycoside phosphotransferase (APT) family kinase protein